MTYDIIDLTLLTLGRTLGVPTHGDAVAAVEYVQFLERDLWLRTLCVHKLLPAGEGGCDEVKWLVVATVDDDRDGGRVIDEVLG
jgi:hypothetical protein